MILQTNVSLAMTYRIAQKPISTIATSSTYKKYLQKLLQQTYQHSTNLYQAGKQHININIQNIINTWNHPLYKDLIEPIYVGLELQHNWLENKYNHYLKLKKYIKQYYDQEIPTDLSQRYEQFNQQYNQTFHQLLNDSHNAKLHKELTTLTVQQYQALKNITDWITNILFDNSIADNTAITETPLIDPNLLARHYHAKILTPTNSH